MRRLIKIIGLVALIGWLAAESHGLARATRAVALRAPVRAAGTAFEPTIPHLGCVENQCVEVDECGEDDCSQCESCDPNGDLEFDCLYMRGGLWNPDTCECSPPICDPWAETQCLMDWGTWNEWTCTCTNECDPQEAVPVGYSSWTELLECTACQTGLVNHVENVDYVQYCADGVRVWDRYSIQTGAVYPDWAWECDWWCWEWEWE